MDRRGMAPDLVLERLFEKVIQGEDFGDLDTMVASDVEFRTVNFDAEHVGIDAYQEHVKQLHEGISDIEISYEILVRTPNSLTVEFTLTGRHTGVVMGADPTEKPITYSGINVYKFEGGLISEIHGVFTLFELLSEIGVVSLPSDDETSG